MSTLRRQPLLFVSLMALLCASALFAQTAATNSSLQGTVTTEGVPLPGVTVTVSSPALQGTRTAITGDGGGYTFPSLPPGEYTIQYTLEGMAPITKKVSLKLATPGRSDAEMKVGSVTESITVTAGSTVTFVNQGANWHSVAGGSGLINSGQVGAGDTYAVTFDEPGTYKIICRHHLRQGMTGEIIVV